MNNNGMNGYGLQITTPEQYAQVLETANALTQRQQRQSEITRSGNPYAMLGSALGGMAANKFGKYKDTNLGEVQQQLDAYQKQQEAQIQQYAAEKEAREAAAKRAQHLADKQAERDFEISKMMKGKEFDVANRAPQRMSAEEAWLMQQTPEMRNKILGQKYNPQSQTFTPEEEALIQAKKVTPDQLLQSKADKVLNVKAPLPPSGEAKNKLGLLETAERDLLKYMDQAFKDGDYQELGSKFGNTDDLFKSAIMNTLRAESGAAIGKDEVSNFEDTYGTSMFRSDETNLAKVQGLLEKIRTQKAAIGGQQPQSQQPQQGGLSNEDLYNKY